jgi:heme a synthase
MASAGKLLPTPDNRAPSPWLHRVAVLTATVALPLIFSGGLVTTKHAGMSVPDWPNSFGYNMFTFPPSRWVGDVLYEHSHRLLASFVGLLSIVLTAVAFAMEARRWVRWLAAGVLATVIVQGVLGGLRVVWVNLNLAMAHGCVAQICFCLAAVLCVVTSRRWFSASSAISGPESAPGRGLIAFAGIAVACVVVQLVIGAVMRHEGAGLAIADFPLSYGHLIPPTSQTDLDAAMTHWGAIREQEGLPTPTLFQVWIHFAHRVGAVVVSIVLLTLGGLTLVRHGRVAGGWLARPAAALIGLLILPVILGILTVLWRKPADVATAHVAVGALVLLTAVVLLVRAARIHYLALRANYGAPPLGNASQSRPTKRPAGAAVSFGA